MSCNILIYGGGAVGSILGWRLAQKAGNEVSVVCRSNFEAVRDSGYTFFSEIWGKGKFVPKTVYKAGSVQDRIRAASPRFDYVVCANKVTRGHERSIDELRPFVRPDTTLVTAQNGMDIEKPLRQAFRNNTILTSICSIGCRQTSPGLVQQTGSMNTQPFAVGIQEAGRLDSKSQQLDIERRNKLADMAPEIRTIEGSFQQDRWRKLIFNSAWNSTTALSGLDTHQLLSVPGAVEVVYQLANETYNVAIASGVHLDEDVPAKTIQLARDSPSTIVPSTLQDARAKRPMELEPIFGYVVNQASKVGVNVPHMKLMYGLLRELNDSFIAPNVPKPESARDLTSIYEQFGTQQLQIEV